jgi:hypothetical protein
LKHLLSAYTGGVGRFFNDSYKTLENAANGKFEATTVPVLNRFVKQYDEDKAFLKDYYTLVDKIRDIEFARDATKKASIGKNGRKYNKALDEYKRPLSSDRYVAAMKAKRTLFINARKKFNDKARDIILIKHYPFEEFRIKEHIPTRKRNNDVEVIRHIVAAEPKALLYQETWDV